MQPVSKYLQSHRLNAVTIRQIRQSALTCATRLRHITVQDRTRMVVFQFYCYVKPRFLDTYVTLQLNCHPAATASLFVEEFQFQIYEGLARL